MTRRPYVVPVWLRTNSREVTPEDMEALATIAHSYSQRPPPTTTKD